MAARFLVRVPTKRVVCKRFDHPALSDRRARAAVRTNAALFKAASLFGMGLWVLGSTLWRGVFIATPSAEIMGAIGYLALSANLASVMILLKYKDGDANVRPVWLCSRNDAIGNVAVIIAALGVWGSATGWPDVVVADIMTSLFLNSARLIVRQALPERRAVGD